ncbi:tudor domain-containing protein 15-like [Bombus fervidus]|uniref:tudor domain-containing protein 15-like n=1 Tax=Bombus fervidus TaxID=203811 RepID=UPI003AB23EA3
MISVDSNEVDDVEVKNENVDFIAPSNTFTTYESLFPFCKARNIVNTLTVGEEGTIEIQTEIKKNTYGVTLLPNSSELDYGKLVIDLPRRCSQMSKSSTHIPNVGDLMCGRRADGDWLRGYFISNQPAMRMAMIEEAKIVKINKTAKCDKIFLDICAFGAICEVSDAKLKFEDGDTFSFEVAGHTHNKKQGEFEILIDRMNGFNRRIRAIVKPWVPMREQIGLQYAFLKTESEVCLTSYQSHVRLFVRPLDTAGVEHYNHVMQNVAKCAQTAPFLKELPDVGQMVIAQFADENYYRVIVTKIQNDRVVVSCVDFGNTKTIDIKKLQILPDNLKQLRSCTTKVILKDVPKNVCTTKGVSDYLAHLVGTKVPLLCTFDDIPSIDGVYLKFRDGESINEMISKLLQPISKETAKM